MQQRIECERIHAHNSTLVAQPSGRLPSLVSVLLACWSDAEPVARETGFARMTIETTTVLEQGCSAVVVFHAQAQHGARACTVESRGKSVDTRVYNHVVYINRNTVYDDVDAAVDV